ncbi:MAG: hypothetical protein K2Q33_00165 [Gammaproteobacteria bacterium]|nr:hypothetical protein [Gammaproteobacteria bacterium]
MAASNQDSHELINTLKKIIEEKASSLTKSLPEADEKFILRRLSQQMNNIDYLKTMLENKGFRLENPQLGRELAEFYALLEVLQEARVKENFLEPEKKADPAENKIGIMVENNIKAVADYVYKDPASTLPKYQEVRKVLIKLELRTTLEGKIQYLDTVLRKNSEIAKTIDHHQYLPFFDHDERKTKTRTLLESLKYSLELQQAENMASKGNVLKNTHVFSSSPSA